MAQSKRNRKRRQSGSNANAGPSARDASRIEAANLIVSGNALLDAGDYDGAIADYERATAVDREVALARRNRGKMASAYASRGNAKDHAGAYEDARADYEFAGELAQGLRPVVVTLEIANLVNHGFAKAEQGDYDGAITDYDRVIALNPNFSEAYVTRGAAKRRQGDYDGAITDYDRAIALEPNLAAAYYSRGIAKHRQGDYDGAVADYDLAIALNPNYAEAYNNRGHAKEDQGDCDGAVADYDSAIVLNPNLAEVRNNRGRAKDGKGDYDGAVADYNHAISVNPNYMESYYNRARTKQKIGDYDGAIADCNQAIALIPDLAEAYCNRGVAWQSIGDYDRAIADYDRAIGLNPGDAIAYYNRGTAKGVCRDFDSAITDFDGAIAINPDYADAYYNRGNAKGECGDFDGAIEDFELAGTFDDDGSQSYDILHRLRAVKAAVAKVTEEQQRLAEVERLRSQNSEKAELLAIADEEITSLEQDKAALAAQNEQLQAELREQRLAARYMPETSGRLQAPGVAGGTDTPCQVQYFNDGQGNTPYIDWLTGIDRASQKRVQSAIAQMHKGNFGDSKSVHASGVFERRLHSGERIYYGKLSMTTIVILHGGDKDDSDQDKDIAVAEERWADYRQRLAQPAT